MNKNKIIAVILLVTIVLAVPVCNAVSLSKPTVALPSNWAVTDETSYPNTYAEHDPAGAGEVTYEDSETYDFVMLYYENAVSSYSQAQLKSEAESIFHIYQANVTMTESGVMTIAGVPAGFAKGYESQYNAYELQIVMVKGNYYFNAYAGYDANSQSESKVMSLLNSINTGGSSIGGFTIWIVIGVVAIVIVIVVVVMLVRKRKTLSSPAKPGDLPPPPPPLSV
jgi:hypothetical protein